jgi:predicted dehydrogenase
MRFFAGDAVWCFAQVKSKGHDITRTDARKATEAIGPVAGDDIHAQFGFSSGVHGSFTSTARLRQTIGQWGLELVGSAGTIRILADVFPRILMLKPSSWTDRGRSDQWTPIEGDPTMNATGAERAFGPANRRVLDDWLGAIEQGREPVCSGRAAAKALEMVMAVYQSALARSRVEMPLKERSHPLGLG